MRTRWAIVAKLLAQRIAHGEYPVGTVMPNEVDLAEQIGVSRSTVRAALNELQQSGMISRRRNAGTRVESLHPLRGPGSYNQTLATIEDVAQYGAQTDRQIQEIADDVTDVTLAALLNCPPGQAWLRVSSLRSSPNASAPPLCWTDVYVAPMFAPIVRERVADYPGLISTLIEDFAGHRTAEIRQTITATGVPKRLAGPLKAKLGAHALEITRCYLDAKDRVFIVSRSIHPADRFSYDSRLKRQVAPNGVYAPGPPPKRLAG
ncbi:MULTISPECIES: GntR family transcriptional regulator [Rhodopseudomonas]|uniref:GntR family transcriptional regulator n=1 Tax=Rhodopseudomonas TaxID=1073 RepID=UPI0005CB0A89|nr:MULTISPECIES: GntR family transcriptional regulator [Rhodopseudomonas]WOK16917.1 GntR family transcriptional regulator [Rhodopseudomonas sp. BAL398]